MNNEQQLFLSEAFDTMASLVPDDHTWTDRERYLYERSIKIISSGDCKASDLSD